jgi:hypothetical protein
MLYRDAQAEKDHLTRQDYLRACIWHSTVERENRAKAKALFCILMTFSIACLLILSHFDVL